MKKHLVFINREKRGVWDEKLFSSHFKGHKLTFLNKLGNYNKIKDANVLSVFVNSKITAEVLDKLPNLEFIGTRSTGFDHIDIEACKKRGIKVAYVPVYGKDTVAEFTFGLILNLSRKINLAGQRTKQGDFTITDLMGFDLKDKVLGVIGTGNIGKNVIRIAHGFEMKILASDPCLDKKTATNLGVTKTSLNDLLKKSDIVTLHCPLCKATDQLLNASNIKLMKKGSLLINTARGELMDTTSIIKALDKGILAGVGLDAVEGEKYIKNEKNLVKSKLSSYDAKILSENHLLLKYSNVIITPHIAFNSQEAVNRILQTTVDNIKAFLQKKDRNLV